MRLAVARLAVAFLAVVFLARRGVVGLAGVDTRALTRAIREHGMPHGVIAHSPDGVFDLEALLAKAGRAIRPKPRYTAVELPGWFAGGTAGLAALALIAPAMDLGALTFVARNAALAMLVPFLLVGLAVIHVWSRRWPARMAILTGCYAVLLLFGWPALLVAGLGFMEQWLLLRRRVAGGTGLEEER